MSAFLQYGQLIIIHGIQKQQNDEKICGVLSTQG